MKKKIIILLCVVLLCISCTLPVLADSIPDSRLLPRVVDDADILTDSEEKELKDKLDSISEHRNMDVVVVTVYSLDGKTPTEYADDFYDYNGYGYGPNRDGILLLLSMEYRDWSISTCGYGITVFTDQGQKYISDQFIQRFKYDNYAGGFEVFADLCDDYICEARENRPYDVGHMPKGEIQIFWIPLAILIGAFIAFIITSIMKAKLKSVVHKVQANDYVRANSFVLRDQRDIFLYSNVSKRAKPKDTGSGSSTHFSSSGTSHGGSSGKF